MLEVWIEHPNAALLKAQMTQRGSGGEVTGRTGTQTPNKETAFKVFFFFFRLFLLKLSQLRFHFFFPLHFV